jgi:hypothetical protein
VERAVFDSAVARITSPRAKQIDRSLPEWARRSNPVVRRHLGEHWKTMSLDIFLLIRIFILNLIFVVITLPLPFLFTIVMPTVMVSMVLLPIGFVMYAQALLLIGILSAVVVADERRNDSLDLLLVSPRPLREVLYSKIAAAVWRQLENLSLVITAAALFSLPLLMIQYDMMDALHDQPVVLRLVLTLSLASILIRFFLEIALVGAIGVMVGASTRVRASAVVTTILLTGAYFAFLNLPRLLALPVELQLFIQIVLPLLLPLLFIPLCLRFAIYLLTRDA